MSSQTRNRQDGEPQGRRVARQVIRPETIAGAVALLLMLMIVLLLPAGVTQASRDQAGAGVSASGVAGASQVRAAPISVAVPLNLGANGATAPISPTAPSFVASQCDGCIEGTVIDYYHNPAGAGWTVTITPVDGSGASIELTVDANGSFRVPLGTPPPGLCPGTYEVKLDVPAGWVAETPAVFTVTLTGEETCCVKVRFKVALLPCLEVVKTDAKDGAGLPGWTFTLKCAGGNSYSAITDGLGQAYFYSLAPDMCILDEVPQTGWALVPPPNLPMTLTIDYSPSPGCRVVPVTNRQVQDGEIRACKFDTAGTPVFGWPFWLTRDDGTALPAPGPTAPNTNCYTFTGLRMGQWTVHEGAMFGYRPKGPTEQKVTLTIPGRRVQVDFANERLGCIDGKKINSLDQGLPDWTITADNLDTGEQFVATTDPWGYFQFQVPLGRYELAEDLPPGWTAVTPRRFDVVLTKAMDTPDDCEHVRFKNSTDVACLEVWKLDAYPVLNPATAIGLPGFTIAVQPAGGGTAIAKQTDGRGYVRFDNLAPGWYDVSETAPANTDYVSAPGCATGICPATYRVYLEPSGFCIPRWTGNPPAPGTLRPGVPAPGATGDDVAFGQADSWKPYPEPTPWVWPAGPQLYYVTFWNIQKHMLEKEEAPIPVLPPPTLPEPPALPTLPEPPAPDPAPAPNPAPAAAHPNPSPQSGCTAWYTVRAGDTLYSVARRYHTTAALLASVNHLSNPSLIYVGQVLRIR